MASYPSGKGEVCKTFMQRFDSARRLYEKDVRAGILSLFQIRHGKAGVCSNIRELWLPFFMGADAERSPKSS